MYQIYGISWYVFGYDGRIFLGFTETSLKIMGSFIMLLRNAENANCIVCKIIFKKRFKIWFEENEDAININNLKKKVKAFHFDRKMLN